MGGKLAKPSPPDPLSHHGRGGADTKLRFVFGEDDLPLPNHIAPFSPPVHIYGHSPHDQDGGSMRGLNHRIECGLLLSKDLSGDDQLNKSQFLFLFIAQQDQADLIVWISNDHR